ncbi:hypothetical protein [Bacillus benzoevorans]|uniref:Uncharacterized protein n=1 Tax=Bacillus benzoevorans TaxID=1456 RepID=A0A7X0HTI7_9BACI|nr:hypothetical protein [Bacillus benzoevorans]MBB6446521.1 hypothetical protein [Bacillus benzoevorans]
MNIRQFYEQSAAASLNAALAALIPPILLLFYSVVITKYFQLLILAIPFLIYSFYCYQVFLLNKNRAGSIQLETAEEPFTYNFFEESTFLLTFLPAPSLRMLFFDPSGIKAGEIRDRSFFLARWFLPYFLDRVFSRKFVLYDQQDKPIVFFQQRNDQIEIITPEGEHVSTVYKFIKGKGKEYLFDHQSIQLLKKGIPADYTFMTSEKTVFGQIQSGLMPLEWGKRFVNPNTPILTFAPCAGEKDRIQLLALLICIYIYRDH